MSFIHSFKFRALKIIKALRGYETIASTQWRGKRLLILCYHGFSLRDEHSWNPTLYMQGSLFEKRLISLQKLKCHVLPLNDALTRLQQNTLPARSVSITVDDGFSDFKKIAYPLLQKYQTPATIYVSTWHVVNQQPVFNLMVDYLLWRGAQNNKEQILLSEQSAQPLSASDIMATANSASWNMKEKEMILEKLSTACGENWENIRRKKILTFMDQEEIRELDPAITDVQLHTHRHRLPLNEELFNREIEDNRRTLASCGINHSQLNHLCYPSGVHHPEFAGWLKNLGIKSATTGIPGLANDNHNPYLLPRFIDTSITPDIEFEAWVSGVRGILKRSKKPYS